MCEKLYASLEQVAEAKQEIEAIGTLLDGCFERRERLPLRVETADAEIEFKHLHIDHPLAQNVKEMFNHRFHCRWSKGKY